MTDQFVAEIRMFPFNFPPTGWAFCDGQILPISQNTALFSLLGTVYGGNGQSTFALPDLRGAVPMHQGQSAGTSTRVLGETSGSDTVTLLTSEMPLHDHSLTVSTQTATARQPAGQYFASGSGVSAYNSAQPQSTNLDPQFLPTAGGSQPHNNMQPSLVLNFCIALQGVFPPRG